jgi:sulfonate transport system permease protein
MEADVTPERDTASVRDPGWTTMVHGDRPVRPSRHSTAKLNARLLRIISIVALVTAWQLVSLLAGRSPLTNQRLVPSAVDLARAFRQLAFYWPGGLGIHAPSASGHATIAVAVLALAANSLATALRLTAGLALGTLAAVTSAVLIGWSRPFRRMFLLPSHITRLLPLLALAPLFSLWFGSSDAGAILFVAFGTFAVLFVVTLTSLSHVPRQYGEYAQSLGANRLRAYVTAVLPAALPGLRGGFLLALGFGWSMAIAAEFLGESVGLGNIVDQAQQFGQTDIIGVVGVVVVIYGALSYRLAARGFDYLVRWSE